MTYVLAVLIWTVAWIVHPLAARAQETETGNLDHLLCYKVEDPLKLETTVDVISELQPEFTRRGCMLTEPVEFCVPASKLNAAPAPSNPEIVGQTLRDDYVCYVAKCPDDPPVPDRVVADQFGQRTIPKFRVEKVCVPARKAPLPCDLIGGHNCGGICPDPNERCDYDDTIKDCRCTPAPCDGKSDSRGVCGGTCPDAGQQCRPDVNNRCTCQPPPSPCTLIPATVPLCGGSCPTPGDVCLPGGPGVGCVCQPPPNPCGIDAASGQCAGLCPAPTETCRLNALGTCVCQPQTVGPQLTFIGVANAAGEVLQPTAIENGIAVYELPAAFTFQLFAEYRPGPSNLQIGEQGTQGQEYMGQALPGLQPRVDMPLGVGPGLGSAQVCDDGIPSGEQIGGVPATTDYGNVDALKDFACRFDVRSPSATACTRNGFGEFAFVAQNTLKQFCAVISQNLSIQTGDTLFSARAADVNGNVGDEGRLIIRHP